MNVFAAILDVLDALIGGGGGVGIRAEADLGAAEEALMIGDVAAAKTWRNCGERR